MDMLFIIGVIWIFIGILKLFKFCTYTKVEAECIELLERSYFVRGFAVNGKNAKYKYLYNDKEYVYQEIGYYPNKRLKEGLKYNLRINPKKPTKCITPSDVKVLIDIFLVGFGMLVFSLL